MPVRVTIPLHLIDEPEVAMRTDISDDYLRELSDNIAANGLINPISVRRDGERYNIAAGHCRYLAHKLLNRDTIEANDFTADKVDIEAIKISENLCRSEVSDYEMALYLAEIQDKYHYDIETLMRLTRRSENWINTRLQLFAGDKAVFDALGAGKIKLSHAVVLNRFPVECRLQYLDAAINSTPPTRVMEQWLIDYGKQTAMQTASPDGAQSTGEPQVLPGVTVEACWYCQSSALAWTMEFPRIHQHCRELIQKAVREAGG